MKNFLIATFILSPLGLHAQSLGNFTTQMKSMDAAVSLGSVLGSEEFCDLSYNQGAISAWIDENTDPSDMGFSSTLKLMTDGTKYDLADMSKSSKTAHCRSITRTAKHYKFVD